MGAPGAADDAGTVCDVLRIDAHWPVLGHDGTDAGLAGPVLSRGGWITLPPCPATVPACRIDLAGGGHTSVPPRAGGEDIPPVDILGSGPAIATALAILAAVALKKRRGT